MEEIIKNLKELISMPIVIILIGVIATYLLSIYSKSKQHQRTTIQVLSCINIEIQDNFANKIKNKYPYNELNLKKFELIGTQAGNLAINKKQIKEINRIYTLFDEINKKIIIIRKTKSLGKSIVKLHEELIELQNKCYSIANEYLNEYFKNK